MSISATVLIAIAALVIGFIVGFCVGVGAAPTVALSTETKNPVQTFNAELKPNEEVTEHVVLSQVVLPKRIKELEYNKRVSAALKDVVDKTVEVWFSSTDNVYKRRIANQLYHDWYAKLENANYHNYNPNLQRLNIVGRRVGTWFRFDAFWEAKDPNRRDCVGYARRHK